MRIVYTSSERFTNEVVSGIRMERMAQLRQRYRSADVLLIDDIQLLGNKERTQEEFFHTFNELHDQPEADRDLERLAAQGHSRACWSACARASSGD